MASNNSTLLAASGISATNMTESPVANLTFTEKLADLPAILWENRDLFVLEFRIIFTAMACIFIGSHAALRRPPSANPPRKKGEKEGNRRRDEEDNLVHGLQTSDAILLPILAGIVLVSLYYLIKWLEDPDILNKILKVYFSGMSLASVSKLMADALHFVTGFIFPTVWIGGDGKLYHVDGVKRGHWHSNTAKPKSESESESDDQVQVWNDKKKTPFPSRWSELGLSEKWNTFFWEVRHLLVEQWTVRLAIHGVGNETFKVRFNDIFGIVLAVGMNVLYYTTESTFLSNVMGYGFSYAGIILMSPTTFATGTAVLFGLFFYDIYMVFYTPYMVTVATKLDVPIKLVFEGPTKSSMLGLGDIVLPGIFVGLCLRFDHYLYYHRQRRLVPVELQTRADDAVTATTTQRMLVKPDFVPCQGQWGDRFWSAPLLGARMWRPDATPALKASAFPKTYFTAALVGYLLAMVATLAMLLVFRHAQPALLYLVPGVVASVWATGLARGELKEMWAYTEDGALDTADRIVEVDGDGNVVDVVKDEEKEKEMEKGGDKSGENQETQAQSRSETPADGKASGESKENKETANEEKGVETKLKAEDGKKMKAKGYPVFLFSIEAPASA